MSTSPKTAAKTDAKPTAKRPQPKSARRRSREAALQGLYQWLVTGDDVATVDAHMRELDDFDKVDRAHFDALLNGCILEAADLDAVLARHVDRKTTELSPIEHGVLMIGAYELKHCIDIPYRVVINEAVELAKSFGGTDGHKYVNGVLDRSAGDLRPVEVAARNAKRNADQASASDTAK
ncbi:transcription antitermination factor NusB [Roseateles sp.]|uniref:transcription antitermination factor NusB n=1 Tax=Roseateles sp. TaxID=1971397 RepID=UPI00286A8AA6|nr:transcription antitermination factor NusB [Roseateles sp.]